LRPDETMGDGDARGWVCLSLRMVPEWQISHPPRDVSGAALACFSGDQRQSPLIPPPLADRPCPALDVNVEVVSYLHTYSHPGYLEDVQL
jgi:hypothetical protein